MLSRNWNVPQGPRARPRSNGCNVPRDHPATSASTGTPDRPSQVAMLLAVPMGRIVMGIDRSTVALATSATVPSPPATTTRSSAWSSDASHPFLDW